MGSPSLLLVLVACSLLLSGRSHRRGIVAVVDAIPCPWCTVTPSITPAPTRSDSATGTVTPMPTRTATASFSRSFPTNSATDSGTITPAPTRTGSDTTTATRSLSSTRSGTVTPAPSRSQTFSNTNSDSVSPSVPSTASMTFSSTWSPVPTSTPSDSRTASFTPSGNSLTFSGSKGSASMSKNTESPSVSNSASRSVSGSTSNSWTRTKSGASVSHSFTESKSLGTRSISHSFSISPSGSRTRSATASNSVSKGTLSHTFPTESHSLSASASESESISESSSLSESVTASVGSLSISSSESGSDSMSASISISESRTATGPSTSMSESVSASQTTSWSSSVSQSASASESVSGTMSASASLSETLSASLSNSISVSLSASLSSTESVSESASESVSTSTSESVSVTFSASMSASNEVTFSSSLTFTASKTASQTQTLLATDTQTISVSSTNTATLTNIITDTLSLTASGTWSVTESLLATPSSTVTPTLTISSTVPMTPTLTVAATATSTLGPTLSFPITTSRTVSLSVPITPTATIPATPSSSLTTTHTMTSTLMATPTETRSFTETRSHVVTASSTPSVSSSASVGCDQGKVVVFPPSVPMTTFRESRTAILNFTIPFDTAGRNDTWTFPSNHFNLVVAKNRFREAIVPSWGTIRSVQMHSARTIFVFLTTSVPKDRLLIQQATDIEFWLSRDLFACRPTVPSTASFRLSAVVQTLNQQMVQAAELTAVASTSVGGLAGPTAAIQQGRVSAVLSLSQCKFSHNEPINRLSSPLGWRTGEDVGVYYRGALTGNAVILIYFVVLSSLVTLLVYNPKKRGVWDSMGIAHLPGILVIPIAVLLQGTVSVSTSLWNHGQGPYDKVLCVLSCITICSTILGCLYLTTVGFKNKSTVRPKLSIKKYTKTQRWIHMLIFSPYKWVDTEEEAAPEEEEVQQGTNEKKGAPKHDSNNNALDDEEMMEIGEEGRSEGGKEVDEVDNGDEFSASRVAARKKRYQRGRAPTFSEYSHSARFAAKSFSCKRGAGFKKHWQQLYFEYREGFQWYLAVEMTIAVIIGVIDGVKVEAYCRPMTIAFLGLLTIQTAGAVFIRPFAAIIHTCFHMSLSMLTFFSTVVVLIGEMVDDEGHRQRIEISGQIMALAVSVVATLKLAFDTSLAFRWLHSRHMEVRKKIREKRRLALVESYRARKLGMLSNPYENEPTTIMLNTTPAERKQREAAKANQVRRAVEASKREAMESLTRKERFIVKAGECLWCCFSPDRDDQDVELWDELMSIPDLPDNPREERVPTWQKEEGPGATLQGRARRAEVLAFVLGEELLAKKRQEKSLQVAVALEEGTSAPREEYSVFSHKHLEGEDAQERSWGQADDDNTPTPPRFSPVAPSSQQDSSSASQQVRAPHRLLYDEETGAEGEPEETGGAYEPPLHLPLPQQDPELQREKDGASPEASATTASEVFGSDWPAASRASTDYKKFLPPVRLTKKPFDDNLL